LIAKLLKKMAAACLKAARKFEPPGRPALGRWFDDNGDRTLRLNYPLDEQSIVFDVGGYEGQWASDLFSRYRCRIHVFEPYPPYAQMIAERFSHNPQISTHAFGLAGETGLSALNIDQDSSSVFKASAQTVEISLVSAADFIRDNRIDQINLMKINIEGGEYPLLEQLIEEGIAQRIDNIQVQFHDFVPDAVARMHQIQEHLRKTHELTYQYEFVWENWSRRK
jgi:FkbM family methyltransferase